MVFCGGVVVVVVVALLEAVCYTDRAITSSSSRSTAGFLCAGTRSARLFHLEQYSLVTYHLVVLNLVLVLASDPNSRSCCK